MAKKVRLNKEQLADIDKQLRSLHDLEDEFSSLEACGEDCSDRRGHCERLREQMTLLKQKFGPLPG